MPTGPADPTATGPDRPVPGARAALAILLGINLFNYIDRQVLGILAPTLQREIGWSEQEYARITQAFTFAYAIGFLGVGRLLDRIGVKRGFTFAIIAWSLAAIGHAFARTAGGFMVAPGADASQRLDIMSVEPDLVGAETFAAVDPRNC